MRGRPGNYGADDELGLGLAFPEEGAIDARGGGDRPRLVVPVTAVFTRADGRAVVVVMRAGRRVPVTVSPGVAYAGKEVVAPVDGDLQAGDQVVIGS